MSSEIEIKIQVSEDEFNLLALKYATYPGYSRREEDIYFNSRHRDLISTEECVRIRSSGSWAEITWKPPTTVEMRREKQFWKEELNLNIGQPVERWIEMLDRLDLFEYVRVIKERIVRELDRETILVLDRLPQVGFFVEIETTSSDASRALKKNRDVLVALGLGAATPINVPYRDIVFERKC